MSVLANCPGCQTNCTLGIISGHCNHQAVPRSYSERTSEPQARVLIKTSQNLARENNLSVCLHRSSWSGDTECLNLLEFPSVEVDGLWISRLLEPWTPKPFPVELRMFLSLCSTAASKGVLLCSVTPFSHTLQVIHIGVKQRDLASVPKPTVGFFAYQLICASLSHTERLWLVSSKQLCAPLAK